MERVSVFINLRCFDDYVLIIVTDAEDILSLFRGFRLAVCECVCVFDSHCSV